MFCAFSLQAAPVDRNPSGNLIRTHGARANNLHGDFDSALIAWRSWLAQAWQQVGDIVPRMPIQASAKTLLIQVMSNQTDTSAQHEKTIQNTHVEIIFGLFSAECAAVAHQVDEADSDTAVDVEDQIILLARGDCLNSDSVIQHLAAWEALLDEFLDELDTEIGIVAGFNLVTDTGDCDCQRSCRV